MSARQFAVIAICVLINAIDGFDILSISLASPGIAAEWSVGQASLGVMLSAELIGMGLGSILIGQVADRIGRRPVLLACLTVMTLGMFGAALAPSFPVLGAARLLTGIGIGGMLPCLSAIVAEVANRRWRAPAVTLMAAGYPAGAVFGGTIATWLLADGGWRDVFHVGALFSAIMLPVAFLLLPEPLSHSMLHLKGRQRVVAVRRSLRMLGQDFAGPLADVAKPAKPGLRELLSRDMLAATLLLTAAYFLHMISFYFFLKWVPKIVADMGFAAAQAGSVLVWANVGGLIGSALFSILTWRFFAGPLLIGALVGTFLLVALFGSAGPDLALISGAAAAAGLFTNAAVVGLYALIAQVYPERLRAGGAGFSLGIGRGGAALGPIIAGLLFARGAALSTVAIVLSVGSLAAAFAVWQLLLVLRRRPADGPWRAG